MRPRNYFPTSLIFFLFFSFLFFLCPFYLLRIRQFIASYQFDILTLSHGDRREDKFFVVYFIAFLFISSLQIIRSIINNGAPFLSFNFLSNQMIETNVFNRRIGSQIIVPAIIFLFFFLLKFYFTKMISYNGVSIQF